MFHQHMYNAYIHDPLLHESGGGGELFMPLSDTCMFSLLYKYMAVVC